MRYEYNISKVRSIWKVTYADSFQTLHLFSNGKIYSHLVPYFGKSVWQSFSLAELPVIVDMLGLWVTVRRGGAGWRWWRWWRCWYNFLLKPGRHNTRAPALARSSPGSRSLLPSFHLDRRRARLWCVSLNSHHYWPQTADTSRMKACKPFTYISHISHT